MKEKRHRNSKPSAIAKKATPWKDNKQPRCVHCKSFRSRDTHKPCRRCMYLETPSFAKEPCPICSYNYDRSPYYLMEEWEKIREEHHRHSKPAKKNERPNQKNATIECKAMEIYQMGYEDGRFGCLLEQSDKRVEGEQRAYKEGYADAQKENKIRPLPIDKCVCGDSSTLNVVHRKDGPCYYYYA